MFWIFQAFFWIFPVGLLWTQNIDEGLRTVGRYAFFLFSPVYLLIARRELIDRCIVSFLSGCAVTECLAYYNWLQIHVFTDWPTGPRVTRLRAEGDTAPFVDRIMYAPILAWAGYLAAHKALKNSGSKRFGYSLLTLLTIINLVFSGGRTGQLAFLLLLTLLIFQQFPKRQGIAALISIVLVGGISITSYSNNDFLKNRVNQAIYEITHYNEAVGTSVGQRINFLFISTHLYLQNPILGVGTGDFIQEYEKLNAKLTPQWAETTNPHNQYLYVLATTGAIGGIILLLTYLIPILQSKIDSEKNLRAGLVVFICFISLFESYLWRSNTSLLYVIFATLLTQRNSSIEFEPKQDLQNS